MRARNNRRKIEEDEGLNLNHHQKKLRYLKARRSVRRLQINLIRFRAFARVLAVLFIIFVIFKVINLPQWYIHSNIFSYYPNNNLEIEGNKIVSTKQILAQLRKVKLPDKPIYLLDTKPIEKSLLKLSPVKKVYIRRFWNPARLKIVVDEKIPVIAVIPSPNASPVAVFTEDSSIIGKQFFPLAYPKKLYKISTYDNFYKWNTKHVNYLIYFSKMIEGVSGQKLVYLDIRNPDDVFAQLEGVKLRIGELDKSVFNRSKRINSVLSEALKIRNDIEYIDLRWDNSVSIKLKDKKKAQPASYTEENPASPPAKAEVKKVQN